jgi:Domain of unknown function (DUF222)
MFELMEPPATADPATLLDDVRAASRAETRAAAQRLTGIWNLHRVRLRENGDRALWAVDTWDAVAAEVAAALNIPLMLAGSFVRLAKAMHERLPLLGMVLAAGGIDYRSFQTMVYRTDLITDPDILAIVDGQLASRAPRWIALSQGKLSREVDRIVAKADQDAVRRRKERVEDREVVVVDTEDGLAAVCAMSSPLTGTPSSSGWMRSRPRSAMPIHVPSSSGGRTGWAPWPPERTDWVANAASPTARLAGRRPLLR